MQVATVLVRALEIYALLGLLFALPFALRWVARVDPVAATGTLGFRLLVIPGAALFWPLLLRRVLAGGGRPSAGPAPHGRYGDGTPPGEVR